MRSSASSVRRWRQQDILIPMLRLRNFLTAQNSTVRPEQSGIMARFELWGDVPSQVTSLASQAQKVAGFRIDGSGK